VARGIAAIAAVLSMVVFVLSVLALAGRIKDYNAGLGRTLFAFREVHDRAFEFAGRPVSITDEDRTGQSVVVVKYGERELRLLAPEAIKPGPAQMPGLVRHADWLRVLRFAPFPGGDRETFLRHLDEGKDRLAIVTRRR
jgi:hypothetical protein